MSSSLYKIVEVYDKNENKWKLAKFNGKFEFKCSLAVRDYLRRYDLDDVNKEDLSEELQQIISEEEKTIYPLTYRYHLLDDSMLNKIRDEYAEKIINITDEKIECDTNDKLNKIMDKLGINAEDAEEYNTVDDLKESIDYYLDVVCGFGKDIDEINLLSKLCAGDQYDVKIRVIIYYC